MWDSSNTSSQWRGYYRARRSRLRSGYLSPLTVILIIAAMVSLALQLLMPSADRPYSSAPRNCTEARAMGLQNIPIGSPYYASHLDRDNDGLACEPWHGHRR